MEKDFRTVVQSWLDGNFDDATKAEILALQEHDMTALEDAFYRNLQVQAELCTVHTLALVFQRKGYGRCA